MRKLLLVATVVLLFSAGCGGSGDSGDSGTAAPSTATATGSAAGADNTKQVCTDAKALG